MLKYHFEHRIISTLILINQYECILLLFNHNSLRKSNSMNLISYCSEIYIKTYTDGSIYTISRAEIIKIDQKFFH